jgi:hypothetical protein
MDEIRSPDPRIGLETGRVMVGIATVAVVLGLASYDPRLFFALLFLGINAGTYLATRIAGTRKPAGPEVGGPRRLRYSIWQIMAASVVVALLAAMVRASVPLFGRGVYAAISSPTLWAILGVGAGILAILGGVIYACWFVIGVVRLDLKRKARG